MLVRLEAAEAGVGVLYVNPAHVIAIQDIGGMAHLLLPEADATVAIKGTVDEVARLLGYTGSVT